MLLLLLLFSGVDISLQVTLVDSQYLPDYEKLNSELAQELISKFVAEVIIISHKASLSADVLWGSFVTHSFFWGRNECVTNEPQRKSAGRLP